MRWISCTRLSAVRRFIFTGNGGSEGSVYVPSHYIMEDGSDYLMEDGVSLYLVE